MDTFGEGTEVVLPELWREEDEGLPERGVGVGDGEEREQAEHARLPPAERADLVQGGVVLHLRRHRRLRAMIDKNACLNNNYYMTTAASVIVEKCAECTYRST